MLAEKNSYFSSLPTPLKALWARNMILREVKKGAPIDLARHSGKFYFPVTSLAAMSVINPAGSSTFIRFSGANAAVGLADSLTADSTNGGQRGLLRCVQHWCCSGYTFELPWQVVFDSLSEINRVSTKATYSHLMIEILVMRLHCAETHSAEQQLASLLLEAKRFIRDDGVLGFTHRELASFLSTRRETVSDFISEWESAGIVECTRGKLVVKSEPRLCDIACACHRYSQDIELHRKTLWSSISWKSVVSSPQRDTQPTLEIR